jgi:hypothetical protein
MALGDLLFLTRAPFVDLAASPGNTPKHILERVLKAIKCWIVLSFEAESCVSYTERRQVQLCPVQQQLQVSPVGEAGSLLLLSTKTASDVCPATGLSFLHRQLCMVVQELL